MSKRAAHYTTFKTSIQGETCMCSVYWIPPQLPPTLDNFAFEILNREGCEDSYLQAKAESDPSKIKEMHNKLLSLFQPDMDNTHYGLRQSNETRNTIRAVIAENRNQAAKTIRQRNTG